MVCCGCWGAGGARDTGTRREEGEGVTGEGQGARREVRGARGEKRGAGSEDAEQSAEERKPLASRPARKRAASRLACSPSPNNFETTSGLERSHLEGSGDFFPAAFPKPDGGRFLVLGNRLGASRGFFAASWGLPGALLSRLAASWGPLGALLCRLGCPWGRLGAVWGRLGRFWGRLGTVLGPSWRRLGPSCAVLEASA